MMKCPKCKDILLIKQSVDIAAENPLDHFFCIMCGGTWVRDIHLTITRPSAFKEDQKQSTLDPLHDQKSEQLQDQKIGLCPEGHGLMVRVKIDCTPVFHLEKCLTCEGVWFDKGELKRVIDNNLFAKLPDLGTRF